MTWPFHCLSGVFSIRFPSQQTDEYDSHKLGLPYGGGAVSSIGTSAGGDVADERPRLSAIGTGVHVDLGEVRSEDVATREDRASRILALGLRPAYVEG
jgi:hypothetical protein